MKFQMGEHLSFTSKSSISLAAPRAFTDLIAGRCSFMFQLNPGGCRPFSAFGPHNEDANRVARLPTDGARQPPPTAVSRYLIWTAGRGAGAIGSLSGLAEDASFHSGIQSYFLRLLKVLSSRILAVRGVDGVPAV